MSHSVDTPLARGANAEGDVELPLRNTGQSSSDPLIAESQMEDLEAGHRKTVTAATVRYPLAVLQLAIQQGSINMSRMTVACGSGLVSIADPAISRNLRPILQLLQLIRRRWLWHG
jgi:hypothetical protein